MRLGAKLNTIGDCAFGGAATNITVASGNKKYSSTNGLLMNKDKTTVIQVPGNKRGALKIPDGVVKCQKKALYHSHISSITLPDSMTKCDAYLFDNCIKLMDINLPATLTKLNMGSWFTSDYLSSDNISSINIPKSNTVYASHDGVLYTKDKKKMLFYPVNKRGTLKLPKELKNLNRNLNTNRLTDIKIPNSNTKFTTKNGLLFDKKVQYLKRVPLKRTEITLPATVKSAGYLENIQSTCNLKSVKVAKMNKNYYSIDGVLFDDYHNTLTFYPPKKSGAYVIPESTRYIDDTAFQYANQLTSLTISKNVKRSSYNIYQFTNCSKLKTVIVKQGKLNTIKMRFRNCDALRTIDLPSSIMNMEIKGLNRNITIKGWSNTNAPDIAKKAKCKFVSKGSAPSMVGNIKIKKIVDKYEISWTPADSADGYQVYTRYETIATVKGRNTTKCVVKDIYDYYEYSSPKIYVRAYKNNGKTKTYGKARSYKMKEKY